MGDDSTTTLGAELSKGWIMEKFCRSYVQICSFHDKCSFQSPIRLHKTFVWRQTSDWRGAVAHLRTKLMTMKVDKMKHSGHIRKIGRMASDNFQQQKLKSFWLFSNRISSPGANDRANTTLLLLHLFNGPFSRITRVSRHQKSRTILVQSIWIYWSKR